MKVASISCIAQHGKGLDLHVRNLRWALSGCDYQIYIMTFSGWRFDHAAYPDVKFIEAKFRHIFHHYHFWAESLGRNLLSNSTEDVMVFTESDQLYHQNISDLCRQVHEKKHIILNNEPYHPWIKKGKQNIYPRLWEGGLIMTGDHVRREIRDNGISFGADVASPSTFEKLRGLSDEYTMWDKQLNKVDRKFAGDNFFELTLRCYFDGLYPEMLDMCCHFPRGDWFAAFYTDTYLFGMTDEDIRELAGQRNTPFTIFLMYLCGVLEWRREFEQIILKASPQFKKHIEKVGRAAHEWMSPFQLDRFNHIKSLYVSDKRMKLL